MMHPNINEGGPMENAFAAPRTATGFTLRQWLVVDALTCVAFGALLLSAAAPLSTLFGLPRSLLFVSGVVLLPCAALMAVAAKSLAAPLAWLVIAGNAAWIAASIAVTWMLALTGTGLAFVTIQAAAVALLMSLEWRALNARAYI
jgi:hypothetical protein